MLISFIVAMARNRVIGRNGRLPWQVSEDLQRFKRLTMGHCLLMGRKTYQSIGRPLPGRRTIVVSRQAGLRLPGCTVAGTLSQALTLAEPAEELFICGGADVFQQTLAWAERIYLTELNLAVAGDSFFPELPEGAFQVLWQEDFRAEIDYRFSILQRPENPLALTQMVKDKL